MKKRITLVLLFAFSLFALVGCEKDTTELNTLSMFGGTDANKETYEGLIAEFEKETGNVVKNRSETSDEEWKASVIIDFLTGDEPDVLHYFTGETAKPLVDSKRVVSIEEIRAEYPDFAKNINPSVLGTHSVPTTGFVEGLFTNKDHFKSAESKAYLDIKAMTWGQFKELLALLVEENKDIPGYYPIAYGMDIPHYWLDHIVAAELGVNYYEEITKAGGEDKMVNALLKLNELNSYFSKDEGYANSEQGFFDGKYTFILDGSWFSGRVTLENATALPFPIVNEEFGSPILAGFTSGFYITRKAWDNPVKRKAAVQFIEKMTSKEALTAFATVGGFAADDTAIPTTVTPLNAELAKLVSRATYQVLPLGDASVAGTYKGLVTGQASFVLGNKEEAKQVVKEYLSGQ